LVLEKGSQGRGIEAGERDMRTHTGDKKECQRIKNTGAKLRDLQGIRECREHGDKSEDRKSE
jgi:hypothetical protein